MAANTKASDKRQYKHELDFAVENVTQEFLAIHQPQSSVQPRPLAPNEKLICCKCGKNFATEKMLRVHENRHNPRRKRKAFACDECDRFFGSKTELKKHKNLYHRPYLACDHCGKEFRYRGWYLQHMQNRVCAKLDEETEEEEMEEAEMEEPELDDVDMDDDNDEDEEEEEEESLLDDHSDFMPGSYSDILNRILMF